jgi:hypothetical protein
VSDRVERFLQAYSDLDDTPDEYGMAHRPPGPGRGAPLHDLTEGDNAIYPDDIYSPMAVRYYGTGDASRDRQTLAIYNAVRGRPDAKVIAYRAVPVGIKGAKINGGDWVTINRAYAVEHGDRFEEGAKILSKTVRADELYTNGDSIHEFGYWPKTRGGSRER